LVNAHKLKGVVTRKRRLLKVATKDKVPNSSNAHEDQLLSNEINSHEHLQTHNYESQSNKLLLNERRRKIQHQILISTQSFNQMRERTPN
jgi:hypothetical protein